MTELPAGKEAGSVPASSVVRVGLAVVVFVATFYFVYWVPFSLLPGGDHGVFAAVGSALCAAAATFVFWRNGRPRARGPTARSLGSYAVAGALVVGGLGFIAGFFGPMLFTPEANQGPLLGLFVTGPAGVVLGAIGGLLVGRARRSAR